MTYKTHIAYATSLGLMAIDINNISMVYLIPVVIGSLTPDIDHHNSKISNTLHFKLPVKHRGITHSFIACLVLIITSLLFSNMIYSLFSLGYISHVALDYMTSAVKIKTAGHIEKFLYYFLVIVNITILFL